MDPELKAKWIAALRSGEFKQAQGNLKDGDAYCCLGVLCKIQGADFDKIEAQYGGLSLSMSPPEYIGCVGRHSGTLSMMNDHGAPFERIANYIEANL